MGVYIEFLAYKGSIVKCVFFFIMTVLFLSELYVEDLHLMAVSTHFWLMANK